MARKAMAMSVASAVMATVLVGKRLRAGVVTEREWCWWCGRSDGGGDGEGCGGGDWR